VLDRLIVLAPIVALIVELLRGIADKLSVIFGLG
jgi:hypothetical protein